MGIREGLLLARQIRYGDIEAKNEAEQLKLHKEELKLRQQMLKGKEAETRVKLEQLNRSKKGFGAFAQLLGLQVDDEYKDVEPDDAFKKALSSPAAPDTSEAPDTVQEAPPVSPAPRQGQQKPPTAPEGFANAPEGVRRMALQLYSSGKVGEAMDMLKPFIETPKAQAERRKEERQTEKTEVDIEKTKEEIARLRRPEEPKTPFQALMAQGLRPVEALKAIAQANRQPETEGERLRLAMTQQEHGLRMQKLQMDILEKKSENKGELSEADKRKIQMDVRKNIRDEPAFKDFQGAKQGYNTMLTGARQQNAAGDLAIINGIQRMLDPGVSVRTEEFKTVQSSQGLLDRINNILPQLQSGQKLGDDVRKRFTKLGRELMEEWTQAAKAEIEPIYGRTVKDTGITIDDVFVQPARLVKPIPAELLPAESTVAAPAAVSTKPPVVPKSAAQAPQAPQAPGLQVTPPSVPREVPADLKTMQKKDLRTLSTEELQRMREEARKQKEGVR